MTTDPTVFHALRVTSDFDRESGDFYPTAPSYIAAGLEMLPPMLPPGRRSAWEPAAGDGRIVDALAARGWAAWDSDLHPRRPDNRNLDFLASDPFSVNPSGLIVTNPPYSHLDEFIAKALYHLDHPFSEVEAVVLLVRWAAIPAARRAASIRRASAILRMPWRAPMFQRPDGSSMNATFDYAWILWTLDHPPVGPVVLSAPVPPMAARRLDAADMPVRPARSPRERPSHVDLSNADRAQVRLDRRDRPPRAA